MPPFNEEELLFFLRSRFRTGTLLVWLIPMTRATAAAFLALAILFNGAISGAGCLPFLGMITTPRIIYCRGLLTIGSTSTAGMKVALSVLVFINKGAGF